MPVHYLHSQSSLLHSLLTYPAVKVPFITINLYYHTPEGACGGPPLNPPPHLTVNKIRKNGRNPSCYTSKRHQSNQLKDKTGAAELWLTMLARISKLGIFVSPLGVKKSTFDFLLSITCCRYWNKRGSRLRDLEQVVTMKSTLHVTAFFCH